MIPVWRAISHAVSLVSPVTILTSMPACLHWRMASGTSCRSGSLMATMASSLWSWAMASVRMACCCQSSSVASASCRRVGLSVHLSSTISGAPFIYKVSPTVVVMYFRSVENGSRAVTGCSSRSC